MTSDSTADTQIVVVTGVSGVGKSTVARALARALDWTFAEGDDFHPEANRRKMASGVQLTDEDRWPWLRAVGQWMDTQLGTGRSAVIACSALRRSYRDLLREGRSPVRFCELDAPGSLIADRLDARRGHYMPPSLLPSQLATLEPLGDDEPGVRLSTAGTIGQIVQNAVDSLNLSSERR
jgi:gluconokinase